MWTNSSFLAKCFIRILPPPVKYTTRKIFVSEHTIWMLTIKVPIPSWLVLPAVFSTCAHPMQPGRSGTSLAKPHTCLPACLPLCGLMMPHRKRREWTHKSQGKTQSLFAFCNARLMSAASGDRSIHNFFFNISPAFSPFTPSTLISSKGDVLHKTCKQNSLFDVLRWGGRCTDGSGDAARQARFWLHDRCLSRNQNIRHKTASPSAREHLLLSQPDGCCTT